ncbi:hypothetical protein AOLI_G00177330 [Acnodon oligacanthus]
MSIRAQLLSKPVSLPSVATRGKYGLSLCSCRRLSALRSPCLTARASGPAPPESLARPELIGGSPDGLKLGRSVLNRERGAPSPRTPRLACLRLLVCPRNRRQPLTLGHPAPASRLRAAVRQKVKQRQSRRVGGPALRARRAKPAEAGFRPELRDRVPLCSRTARVSSL